MRPAFRRTMLRVVKFALAAAILLWLGIQARDGFRRLLEESIHWPLLGAALLATFGAAALSFVRWHLLIRAQAIEIRLVDTLRLGALGMALNFVSLGAIGGDLFKAIFLAHGQPGRRTEAVATVIIDRIVGLLTMLVLASGGILATNLLDAPSAILRALCQAILFTAIVGWSGVALLLFAPALTGPALVRRIDRQPLLGHTAARLLAAVRAYRDEKRMLLAAFALSTLVAILFVTSYYLIARGLPMQGPTWTEHLVIVPAAGLAGAIPITPNGLGTLEAAIEFLYRALPGAAEHRENDGTLVAFTRRITEIAVALLGVVFYLTHRREVEEVFAEAETIVETSEPVVS